MPCEECMIIRLLDDLFLKSSEGSVTFSIKHRYVNVENTEKTIRTIFDASCRS